MNPLIINFLIILFVAILCSLNTKGNNNLSTKVFVRFSFICLLIFRSLLEVDSVPDLPYYKIGYEQICNMDLFKVPLGTIYDVKMHEPGFRIFMKLISYLSDNFTIFLIIFGFFWILGYYKTILRYSNSVILSIIILLLTNYNQSIFVLRQHFALMIIFLSYPYIISKKLSKYLLLFVVAVMFHQTAIIAFPLYFLYNIKDNKKLLRYLILIAICFMFSFSFILYYFSNNILLGLDSYIESDKDVSIVGALIVFCNLFFYIYFLKKDVLKEGINRLMLISLVLGFILIVCGTIFSFVGINRLVIYYTGISFLLIPNIKKYIKSNVFRILFMLSFLSLSYYLTFWGSNFESLDLYKLKF